MDGRDAGLGRGAWFLERCFLIQAGQGWEANRKHSYAPILGKLDLVEVHRAPESSP